MRISEASEESGISTDTLRYYERIGLIPPINRSDSGIRDYSELDIQRVEFIRCMRSAGLTIDVLLEYFKLMEQGDQTIAARKQLLIEQRNQLLGKMAEMQETLELLGYKIEVYDNLLLKKEKELMEIAD